MSRISERLVFFLQERNDRERLLLMASFWGFAFFLGNVFFLLPSLKAYRKVQAQRGQLQGAVSSQAQQLAGLERLKAEKKGKESELAKLKSDKAQQLALRERLRSVSMVDFVKAWAETAQAHRVRLESVQPVEEVASKKVQRSLLAEVKVKGKFQDLLTFFTLLDSLKKVPEVTKLQLAPSNEGYPYLLATLQIALRLTP